jgi:methionyl-tRNA formyltransferase
MGTPESAVPSLDAILAARHEIPLVVTQPDRPAGRSGAPRPPPVKVRAEAHGIPVIQPAKVRTPDFRAAVAEAAPDVIAVVAYGRILTRPVRDTARMGAVNLHFSLLPAYRGAAPVQWALARGEHVTGITTFRLDDGLDTGDALAHRKVPIFEGEHAPALLARLAEEGAALLVGTLVGLAAGSIRPVPQDATHATAAPLLRTEDGLWDPVWSASDVFPVSNSAQPLAKSGSVLITPLLRSLSQKAATLRVCGEAMFTDQVWTFVCAASHWLRTALVSAAPYRPERTSWLKTPA